MSNSGLPNVCTFSIIWSCWYKQIDTHCITTWITHCSQGKTGKAYFSRAPYNQKFWITGGNGYSSQNAVQFLIILEPSTMDTIQKLTLDRKRSYTAYNCVIQEPTLVVVMAGYFVTKRLSSAYSAESKSWRSQIYRWSWCGNRCDTMADNTAHGLTSRGKKKAPPTIGCLSCGGN